LKYRGQRKLLPRSLPRESALSKKGVQDPAARSERIFQKSRNSKEKRVGAGGVVSNTGKNHLRGYLEKK